MKRIFSYIIFSGFILLFLSLLYFDLNKNENRSATEEIKAVVTEVDNSGIVGMGLVQIGFQHIKAILLEGPYKGKVLKADNQLMGQLEFDEIYSPGDKILLAVSIRDGKPDSAKALNNYRQHWELLLFGFFILVLLVYAKFTGLKALLSFIASFYILWQIFIPALIAKADPVPVTIFTLILLTVVIIFSVAGFSKVALSATLSTLTGLAITLLLTLFFGARLKLGGLTAPFASTLIFSGNIDLNIRDIFYASVLIGASGAAMDIAMDVTASVHEVKKKKPEISVHELIQSGMNVGKMVTGTMTTTLLLAYSGGYLTMLMLFVSKGSSFTRILNFKMVAAEIFRTLVGSIGLVLVAPIAAVIASYLFSFDMDKDFLKKVFSKKK